MPALPPIATALIFAAGVAGAAEPLAVLPAQLAGKTLSAVAYVPRPAGAPGGGTLQRIMLQAYLAADGSAVVRQWAPERNSYTAAAQTKWSLADNRLCVDLATSRLCAVIHIWGPRIAGIGTQPYAMLDGDLQPGNALGSRPARPPM